MKKFENPICEVVRFENGVIATSGCGCYDPDFGNMGTVCTGDVGYCACTVNHSPAEDNCTPCTANQGA